jgi:5-methylcytosine-specific restriction protein A
VTVRTRFDFGARNVKRRKILKRRKALRRYTPLVPSLIPLRRRDTGPALLVRQVVRHRAGGRCERCGRRGGEIHHRRPRGMGGSSDPATNGLANLVLLCRPCHRWVESHRCAARAAGWLVWQGHDPAAVALQLRDRSVLLTDIGEYLTAADEPALGS